MTLLVYGLLGLVIYLIFDFASQGQVFRTLFCRLHPLFYRNPKIGKFLGVRYLRTDEWSTNRTDSRLAIGKSYSILGIVTGLKFKFGDRHDINVFKARQRQFSRPLNVSSYIDQVLEKRLSVQELEELLLHVWTQELTECYGITLPDNEHYAALIVKLRKLIGIMTRSYTGGVRYMIQNFSDFMELRSILSNLSAEEQLILTVPFLTTVDSSLFNFTSHPEPVKQFNELFHDAPLEYVPIDNKDGQIILFTVANNANHPGNSVFGAQGMICPGNTVTSMLMKSVADLKKQYRAEVEGKVDFHRKGALKQITNPESVYVTFHQRSPGEVEDIGRENDLDLTRTPDD